MPLEGVVPSCQAAARPKRRGPRRSLGGCALQTPRETGGAAASCAARGRRGRGTTTWISRAAISSMGDASWARSARPRAQAPPRAARAPAPRRRRRRRRGAPRRVLPFRTASSAAPRRHRARAAVIRPRVCALPRGVPTWPRRPLADAVARAIASRSAGAPTASSCRGARRAVPTVTADAAGELHEAAAARRDERRRALPMRPSAPLRAAAGEGVGSDALALRRLVYGEEARAERPTRGTATTTPRGPRGRAGT